MKLSGKDLATKLDRSPSTICEARKKGSLVDGRWDVQAWAVTSPSGRLRHYEVPNDAPFLTEGRSNPSQTPNSGDSVPDVVDMMPSLIDASPETSDGETSGSASSQEDRIIETVLDRLDGADNVSRETRGAEMELAATSRNAGIAYTAGQAVVNDTPGAHAFWTFAPALVGGMASYEATESAAAAFLTALLCGGAGYAAYDVSRQRSAPENPSSKSLSSPAPTQANTANSGAAKARTFLGMDNRSPTSMINLGTEKRLR